MAKNEKLRRACNLLEEAERLLSSQTREESMQASEKIWEAFVQATKAYME